MAVLANYVWTARSVAGGMKRTSAGDPPNPGALDRILRQVIAAIEAQTGLTLATIPPATAIDGFTLAIAPPERFGGKARVRISIEAQVDIATATEG